MKLFRLAALSAAIASVLLPALQATALPAAPDYPCYMQTTSGRSLDLTGLCNGSKNASAFTEAGKSTPFLLSDVSIRNAATRDLLRIDGYITNQTNEEQDVSSFDYKLWDRATRQYVAVSIAPVSKTIPAHGRVKFETVIERDDVNGASPYNLVLEPTKFR